MRPRSGLVAGVLAAMAAGGLAVAAGIALLLTHIVQLRSNANSTLRTGTYLTAPAASSFTTAAAFASRNYAIASGSAWSERLDAQGFATPIWQNPSGASMGTPQFVVVDGANGTATLILPQATFGTVGPGWVFTVALTGQDGFGTDQARDFTATPGAFTFGVCQPGAGSPICQVDPSTVPKVMDTITPSGVSQDTELDPTRGQVQLQGVSP